MCQMQYIVYWGPRSPDLVAQTTEHRPWLKQYSLDQQQNLLKFV